MFKKSLRCICKRYVLLKIIKEASVIHDRLEYEKEIEVLDHWESCCRQNNRD